jgi:hypothetical protein
MVIEASRPLAFDARETADCATGVESQDCYRRVVGYSRLQNRLSVMLSVLTRHSDKVFDSI